MTLVYKTIMEEQIPIAQWPHCHPTVTAPQLVHSGADAGVNRPELAVFKSTCKLLDSSYCQLHN